MLPILSIRIKELRKKKKWSQKELGEKVDVSESFISKVESGKKQPSREVTAKIAEIFNATTDYLLGRSNDPRLDEDGDKATDELARKFAELVADLPKDEQENVWKQALMYVNFTKNKSDD
ncbi:transcriptional regulator [Bacillus thuringiensis]|uniref:Transcriptional regulator n=1 Tax=Bacillus thuringiensis TaxID=1428 RepID=A0A9X7C186_BACTU|nr:helix-turn-helix transcriptional regulator [Bacillus thuringiensis]PGH85795.1 transcriptional regulator [Bacillus thuringiensis]